MICLNVKMAFNQYVEGHFVLPKRIILLCILFTTVLAKSQDSLYSEKMDYLFEKGYENFYVNQDSAIYYFDKMRDQAKLNDDLESTIDASIGMAGVFEFYNNLKDLKATLNNLDSIFEARTNSINSMPDGAIYKVHLAYQKGHYYYVTNTFEMARKSFNQMTKTIENLPETIIDNDLVTYLSTAYSYLAKMYSDEGKLDLANEYYERNIRYLKLNNPDDKGSLYGNYDLIAEVLKRKKLYKKANSYLLKTLDYNLKNPQNNSILTIMNIVQNHNSLNQKDSAIHYLKIAKSILKDTDPSLSHFHEITAETFSNNGDYKNGLREFNIALSLTKKKWNYKPHWEIAHLYHKIGALNAKNNQYHKALNSFNEAIHQLNSSNSILNRSTEVKIYKDKVSVLNLQNSKESYLNTNKALDIAMQLLDTLKPTFKNQEDKLFLIEEAFPLFESGLEAAYNLKSSKGDFSYTDKAFHYLEKSKSVLLLESLLTTKATKFANIPNEMVEQESQLKSEITIIEKQINNSQTESPELEDQLFELKNDHRNLIQKIETSYPSYYNLKYNTEVMSVSKTQHLLGTDEMMISYFYGNAAIYAISVSNKTKSLIKIPLNPTLEEQIRSVHNMLKNPKSDISTLSEKSFSLYQLLMQPLLKKSDKTKLIIIPDGPLNYLPFGSLNTKKDGIHYLIEDKTIGYANSATLWAQLKERKNENTELLAFAPSFSGEQIEPDPSRDKLLPLPHNRNEVEQILSSFEGDSFLNSDASLSNFNSNLADHGILHLATHAIFNDDSPEYSYLAFTPKKNEESLLYVRDLYNLNLNMGMVTLSACESGIGELRRGEGFLSLARGFFFSGASSITSTLWKINDASSTQLMDSFYSNLSKGESKDKALQTAQKSFLNTHRDNALSHPYYWSGFIISGNTAPLITTSYTPWVIILLVLFGAVFFYFFRKRNA